MATSISSHEHVRKRPYHPSITSFFNNRSSDQSAYIDLQKSTASLSPSLPADTQASLLSVGMRVRKSVPEGYKTHKTLGMEEVPFSSTAPPAQPTYRQRSFCGVTVKELVPFCGLHKTGGLAAQEAPSSSAPAVMVTDEDEEQFVPRLVMSQSTLLSTRSSFTSLHSAYSGASKKRAYEEEMEDEMDAYFDEIDAGIQEAARTDRPMARMKQSFRKLAVDNRIRVFGEDDFEEAAFLAPVDSMDMDDA